MYLESLVQTHTCCLWVKFVHVGQINQTRFILLRKLRKFLPPLYIWFDSLNTACRVKFIWISTGFCPQSLYQRWCCLPPLTVSCDTLISARLLTALWCTVQVIAGTVTKQMAILRFRIWFYQSVLLEVGCAACVLRGVFKNFKHWSSWWSIISVSLNWNTFVHPFW